MLQVTLLHHVYIEMCTWSLQGGQGMQAGIAGAQVEPGNLLSSAFVSDPSSKGNIGLPGSSRVAGKEQV